MSEHRTRLHFRWADIDANFHLRHSVYYDLCAQQRMAILTDHGLSLAAMMQHGFGPVLLREECVFRREIKLEDEVWSELRLRHLSRDHVRFGFAHILTKGDGAHCAHLMVDGAWMDTRLRKLCAPPAFAIEALEHVPRSEDFTWLERK